jgi:hypothetical protein
LDIRHQSFSIFSSDGLRLRDLALALVAGLVLYIAVFGFLVHKPLTVGIISQYIEYKHHYLESLGGRQKIVILAGSNGRFSHRCEEIARNIEIPCVNLSISADLDLLWQFRRYAAALEDGDVLYLPLEYYGLPPSHEANARARVGGEAPYIVAYDKWQLKNYTAEQVGLALFQFDIKYLLSGFGEMALSGVGKERRYSLKTMTMNGDERGHAIANAKTYQPVISRLNTPEISRYPQWLEMELVEIFKLLQSTGVTVVGGLPTIFDDEPLTDTLTDELSSVFTSRGHCFIILPNRSQYPRSQFYDTAYHLSEEAQIHHSKLLAYRFGAVIKAGGCRGNIIR